MKYSARSALLLLACPLLANAAERFTAVGVNWAGTEPCLYGDASGVCSEGQPKSAFLHKDSIVKTIGDDLNRSEGLSGTFARVSDDADQLWRKVAAAGERGIRVRVRSRYAGAPHVFGIVRAENTFLRVVAGLAGASKSKIFLSDCSGYAPKSTADQKLRCANFADHEAAAELRDVPVPAGEKIQFAIERATEFLDLLTDDLALRMATAMDEEKVAPGMLRASLESANSGGKDQMVTFRFSQKSRTPDGLESEIYLLAFEDDEAGPMSDYNDYIVEVRLAEPAGK